MVDVGRVRLSRTLRRSYDVAFEPVAAGELIVHVNGVAVPLTVVNEPGPPNAVGQGGPRASRHRTAARPKGPLAIVAPMPGRIVKVLVKLDETVAARQPLVVVEAMKMENELRAPRAGIVADVRVTEGASVEANTVLVVLEVMLGLRHSSSPIPAPRRRGRSCGARWPCPP